MKTNLLVTILCIVLTLLQCESSGQIGISDTGTLLPDSKSILDLTSITRGVLLPRLTSLQMSSIVPAPDGLLIYNTDSSQFYYYNNSIGGWQNLNPGSDTIKHICGAPFQDKRDNRIYSTTQIGNQCWMTDNLRASIYRNGDAIPNVTDNSAWYLLTTGAYCWYNNDSATFENPYGKIYNHYAVADGRGLCPEGWHVPSDNECEVLRDYLGGASVAGGKMKEAGYAHWDEPNEGATNESGFTGLPDGIRREDGYYVDLTHYGYFWTSTLYNSTYAYTYILSYWDAEFRLTYGNYIQKFGWNVRCLKD